MAHIDADAIADRPTVEPVSIDLYWIPLGADATVVRVSGRIYEFIAAKLQRRRRCDLYHSALIVRLPSGPVAVETFGDPVPLISTFETKTGVNAPLELPYVTVPETVPVTATLPPVLFVHGVFSLYIKAANPIAL